MEGVDSAVWRCPDDSAVLRIAGNSDPTIAVSSRERVCRNCEGSWLPGPLVTSRVAIPAPERLREVGQVSPRRCPIDGSALLALEHHDVEIDICAECSGIWLDAGERDKLLNDRRDEDADDGVDLDFGSGEGDASGSDALEAVGEAIGNVFEFVSDLFSGL